MSKPIIENALALQANENALFYGLMSPVAAARAIIQLQRQLQALEVRLAALEAAKK